MSTNKNQKIVQNRQNIGNTIIRVNPSENVNVENQNLSNMTIETVSNDKIDFGVKPCYVKLTSENFSQMKMKYSVTSTEQGVSCQVTQENSNTFCVKIKRKCNNDNSTHSSSSEGPKHECDRILRSRNNIHKNENKNIKRKSVDVDDAVSTHLNPSKKPKLEWDRILRPRNDTSKNANEAPKKKKSCKAVIKSTYKKPVPRKIINSGDVILCKMRGFCEWPAIITKIENKSITVEFLGNHTTTKTTSSNIYDMVESVDAVVFNIKSRKSPLYRKAVQEAERLLGIPPKNSMLAGCD